MYALLSVMLLAVFVPVTAYGLGYGVIPQEFDLKEGDVQSGRVIILHEPYGVLAVHAEGDGAGMLVLPETITFGNSDSAPLEFDVMVTKGHYGPL